MGTSRLRGRRRGLAGAFRFRSRQLQEDGLEAQPDSSQLVQIPARGYHGSGPQIDTCFALLFLKRANLARDLTRKLDFFVETGERK